MLPLALRRGISANAVSLCGLALGLAATACFAQWTDARAATLGFVILIGWLIADGLDGMVARATNTASAIGRLLDGICDHGVFILLYVTLAVTLGTPEAWVLAFAAGGAHAMQSSLYESERHRFHRRVRGDSGAVRPLRSGNWLERGYDAFAGSLDRISDPFDRALRRSANPAALGAEYGRAAAPALHFMALLTANTRVIAIFVACLAGNPRFFWWFEIVPLTAITIIGIAWHRRVETHMLGKANRYASAEVPAESAVRFHSHSSEGF